MSGQQYRRNGDTHIEFKEGLFIRVPQQSDGTIVEVVRKSFGSPLAGNFQVIRPLVNFCFKDSKGTSVTSFDPPMELLVRFTQHDLDEAEPLDGDLVFAYYHRSRGWVKLPPGRPDVTRYWFFERSGGGFGGFDKITLSTWPKDPGNAWGV